MGVRDGEVASVLYTILFSSFIWEKEEKEEDVRRFKFRGVRNEDSSLKKVRDIKE